MVRQGTIYKEIHNHGRSTAGNQDGNRSSMRRVRGVGVQRCYGYRWVGEIYVHGKRYRCRSYDIGRVEAWLYDMREKFSNTPYFSEEGYQKMLESIQNQKREENGKFSR